MRFVPALSSFANDTAAQTAWATLKVLFQQYEGYSFYKHPLLPTSTFDAPDLAILARDHAPVVVVIIKYNLADITHTSDESWTANGQTFDSPLLQLDDFVIGLDAMLKRERTLRGIKPTVGVLSFPLISRNDAEVLLKKHRDIMATTPILICAGEGYERVLHPSPMAEDVWAMAKSVFQGASVLNRTTAPLSETNTFDKLGPAIHALEREISLFDDEQVQVAIQMAPGPQRIRGLAGTERPSF